MMRSRRRRTVFGTTWVLAGVALASACGGSSAADAEDLDHASTTTVVAVEPDTEDAFMGAVAEASAAFWGASDAAEANHALPVGPQAVDGELAHFEQLREQLGAVVFPEGSGAGTTDAYEAYVASVASLLDGTDVLIAQLVERGTELQREIDEAGDDLGFIMEVSELGRLREDHFALTETVRSSCFALQEAWQDSEPVVVCQTNGSAVDVEADGRVNVDASPAFSIVAEDPDSVFSFTEGVGVDDGQRVFLTTEVQLADPNGPYFGLGLTPIEPPAELATWIAESTVIAVTDQGSVEIDGIASNWWTVVGDAEGIAAVVEDPGMNWVALFQHAGIGGPEQIDPVREIGIWEIPHPDGTVYAFGLGRGGAANDHNRAVVESVLFG